MKKRLGENFEFSAIGFVQSPFKDKFGIPRQPGLVSQAKGLVKLADDPDLKTALRSLDEFSHIWIVFVFHQHGGRNWKPSIRPPRLGGARKVGVLASRSPHRPNPIGLSVVSLERVDLDAAGGPELHVCGLDLLDGTPVLDLKPYLPYADSIPEASSGWASEPIHLWTVHFSTEAEATLKSMDLKEAFQLREMIREILQLDPRPAFQKRRLSPASPEAQNTRYGIEILNHEIKYEIREGGFWVLQIV